MGAVICFVVNRLIYTHFYNRRFAVQNAARSNYISKGSIPFLTSNVYKYFPLAFFEIVNKITIYESGQFYVTRLSVALWLLPRNRDSILIGYFSVHYQNHNTQLMEGIVMELTLNSCKKSRMPESAVK